jgi:GNAT superfamily N-acetyltransferase
MRRAGIGGNLLRRAAVWAGENGAHALGLAVTKANAPARALYASLGMKAVGQYHYRGK